jgi:hypothetical protein
MTLVPQARAHVTVPGLPAAYAGFLHALTEPPSPLAIAGLGLLLGLQGPEGLRWSWPAFAVSMLAGMAAMLARLPFLDPRVPLVVLPLLCGLTAAAGIRVTGPVAASMGLAAGYFLGVVSAPPPASWVTTLYAVSGALLGANFALIFIVAAVDLARQRWPGPWLSVGLRIIASWIAAISLLLLALEIR